MRLYAEKTVWQSDSHIHRNKSRRSLSKIEPWPFVSKHGARELADDLVVNDKSTGYPSGLLNVFNAAMQKCPSISLDSTIMEGQPCIAGTRIPVRSVLRVIEHYGSIGEAIKCYPHLTTEQVKDALYFSQILLELPGGIDEPTITS